MAQSRSAESPMSAEHQGLEEDGHDTAAAEDTTDAVSPAESAETASNTAATDEASEPAEDSAQ